MTLGLQKQLRLQAQLALDPLGGVSFPTSGPIDVFVRFGDSNDRGTEEDNQTLSFTPDAGMLTYTGSGWQKYVPNTNPAWTPAAGQTKMHYGTADTHWAAEAQFLKNYRAANPRKTVAIIDYSAAGSFANSQPGNQGISYDASLGTLYAQFISKVPAALTALTNAGYTPTVRMVWANLGVNDASDTTMASNYQTAMGNIIAGIKAQAWYVAGTTLFLLNRITTGQPFAAAVRTAQVALASAAYDVFWMDTDSFGKNAPGDTIHYNAAGQTSIGDAGWASYISPENALLMTSFGSAKARGWWDAGYGVTGSTASAWADRIAEMTPVQATGAAQPAFNATGYNNGPCLTFDGVDDNLMISATANGLPVGSNPVWVFVVVQQDALAADATTRAIFCYGVASANADTERRTSRAVNASTNRLRAQVGRGSGTGLADLVFATNVDFSGKHIGLVKIASPTTAVNVDNNADVTGSTTPNTPASTYICIGAAGGNAQFFQGKIRDIIVCDPLSASEEAAVRALLASR